MLSNYLKYWRIVRRYFQTKYDLSQTELEMLLFLHDEKHFSQATFNRMAFTSMWDRGWVNSLVEKGWVALIEERKGGKESRFQVTKRTIAVINHLYNILDGKELIPEDGTENPMFLPYEQKKHKYKDTQYQKMMVRMNEETVRKINKGARPIKRPRPPFG